MSENESIESLKNQIEQLEALKAAGTLSAPVADEAKAELERRIVKAVMSGSTVGASTATASSGDAAVVGQPAQVQPSSTVPANVPAQDAKPSSGMVLGLVAFLAVVAMIGYGMKGHQSRGDDEEVSAQAATSATSGPDAPTGAKNAKPLGTVEDMVGGLAEKVKKNPGDLNGQLMLARSYVVIKKPELALDPYRKVVELDPKNAQAMAELADVLASGSGKEEEAAKVAQQALAIDSKNSTAMGVQGDLLAKAKKYAEALKRYEAAKAAYPADTAPEMTAPLRQKMADTRKAAGMPAVKGEAPEPAAAPVAPAASGSVDAPSAQPAASNAKSAVSGRVELSAALKAKASPDDTVFVFARPSEGSRMPLAITRKKVSDLPFDFKLDDSMAMSPAANLSSAKSVIVGARVSKAGQAMPQPGDLEGVSATVQPGASGLKIVIGSEVK